MCIRDRYSGEAIERNRKRARQAKDRRVYSDKRSAGAHAARSDRRTSYRLFDRICIFIAAVGTMSAVKKLSIFCSIAVLSIFVLFIFRTVPSGNLWERYRIVYVDNASDDDYAAEVLKKAGCENVISLSSQRLPVMLPVHSPEVSLALAFSDADGYLAKRRAYFFDRGAQYRLYYICLLYTSPSPRDA